MKDLVAALHVRNPKLITCKLLLGVHPRTVERRRAAVRRLSPLETQRKEKLHRIWKQLLELYNPENALQSGLVDRF